MVKNTFQPKLSMLTLEVIDYYTNTSPWASVFSRSKASRRVLKTILDSADCVKTINSYSIGFNASNSHNNMQHFTT